MMTARLFLRRTVMSINEGAAAPGFVKSTQKLSQKRMRIVIESLEERPILAEAAAKAAFIAKHWNEDKSSAALLRECEVRTVDAPMNRKPIIDSTLVADGFLFPTHLDRCRYIGKSLSEKARWLKENASRVLRIDDVKEELALREEPIENENNGGLVPADPACKPSSFDAPKDCDDDELAPVDPESEKWSPACQPALIPTQVKATVASGSTHTKLLPTADAAASEKEVPQTKRTPLRATGCKQARSDERPRRKQKAPAGTSKAAGRLSPERMRIVLDSLRDRPFLWYAAAKAGIHRKTLHYWMKCSEAGQEGYDVEWDDFRRRFHEHCESAIEEAHGRLDAAVWNLAFRAVYKTDLLAFSLGYRGPDAYAMDEYGMPIVQAYYPRSGKWIRYFLERKLPEKWGKHPKVAVPRTGGVFRLGESTKKPENNSAASIRARKWKSLARKIDEA
jgi:hypothetical protein